MYKQIETEISDNDNKLITSFAPTVIEKVKESSQEILMNDILKYFIIDASSGKVKLNQELIADRGKLLSVFDVFFKKYLIENLNYEHFSMLIFDFEQMIIKAGEISLGTNISEFKPSRREKYDKFILNYAEFNSQLLKVECTFSRIYIETENGKEVIFDYKFDEFVAYMFSKGLRYGLDTKEINKGIFAQYHKAAIANIRPPTVGKPSSLEVIVNLKPDKKHIEVGEKENVNFKKYKCTFPEINCNDNDGLIAIKTKPTFGNKGMQIDGKIIEGFLGEDKINLQLLCGKGTSYSEDNDKVYVKAIESGFINAETEYDGPGVFRPTKITVSKEIAYRGDIGKETQSLEITCGEKISLTGSIKKYYELIGNNIRVENGNIEGKVTSMHGNVNIFGNVINGNVTALDGNTFINGNVITSSYIESLKGDIEIDYAEFSTIIGKNVKINKKAIGCTIICDNLIVEEMNACNLLIKKSIKVNKFEAKYHKGEQDDLKTKDTRIILLFKKDILGNIEMLKKIKRKMAIYLHKDNSSPEAVEKMEELNRLLSQVSSDQEKREQDINKEEYSIDINYGKNEQYLNMKLADFFESFHIEDLNNLEGDSKEGKKENKKEILLEKLKHLFSEWDNDHIGKLMLGDFKFTQFTDYTSILKLDFDKIKKVIEHEINETCLIRNPKELRINGIERREEYRMEFGYMKIEGGIPVDIILNEKVPIKIDSKDGFLKDISVGGIGLFLNKDKIGSDEDIFYQENDIVDLNMHLEGLGGRERIFNLKLILTFRKEIGDKVMFGAKFIGLRGKIDTEMRQCIKKFEIENLRKTRELQFASILNKKAS